MRISVCRGENAPAHGDDAVLFRKQHRRQYDAGAQREASQLGGDVLLRCVQKARKANGGDVEHQRQQHRAHQLHSQVGLGGVKAYVDQSHQRPCQHEEQRRDYQRRQREQVQRVAGEVVGPLQAVLLPLLNVQGDQRGRDAGIEQQYRQVEQAVGRHIGVVGHACAEVVGQDHVPHEAEDLAEYDDAGDQHRRLECPLRSSQSHDLPNKFPF